MLDRQDAVVVSLTARRRRIRARRYVPIVRRSGLAILTGTSLVGAIVLFGAIGTSLTPRSPFALGLVLGLGFLAGWPLSRHVQRLMHAARPRSPRGTGRAPVNPVEKWATAARRATSVRVHPANKQAMRMKPRGQRERSL